MNTKIIGVVVGALILLAGVGGFFLLNNKSQKQAPASQTANQNSTPSSTEASIKSLLASKSPKQCDFSDNNVGTSSFTGTVFVANGKASGEFNVKTQAGSMVSHMISDGTTAYIWTGNTKQGFKISLAGAQASAGSTKDSQSVDVNKTFNFKCKDWVVDDSKFVLPTDVTFSSIAVPNTSPAAGGASTPPSSCTVCAGIPAGPGKTECLNLYHCQ